MVIDLKPPDFLRRAKSMPPKWTDHILFIIIILLLFFYLPKVDIIPQVIQKIRGHRFWNS